ncbi:hypothetical protein [Scandinavium sp.]|uniref:hypothetical protein n=1 Tax=Scandinavium sp. TaxID=2830653 RepID=UPI0028972DA9|nr:hypothetical protein [Scandinavium sp.]
MSGIYTSEEQEVLKGIIPAQHGSVCIFSINQIERILGSLIVTDNALTGSDPITTHGLFATINNIITDAGERQSQDNGDALTPDAGIFPVARLKFPNGINPEGERCFLHPSILFTAHISDIFPALLKGRTSVPGHLYLVFPVALPSLNTFPACLNINICGIPSMPPRAPPCHSLDTNANLFHITLLI